MPSPRIGLRCQTWRAAEIWSTRVVTELNWGLFRAAMVKLK